MPRVEGLGARQAALRLLDAVLRTGATLDSALGRVTGLSANDRGLAAAIAGETLRRLPDLDALIDSATRNRLADDAKARMVLRLALAQKVGLGTPDHAIVSTALPLVDGGPRRLVHGVLGTLLRRGLPAIDSPRLPPDVEHRWAGQWGEPIVAAARASIGRRPPLDLSFKDDESATSFLAEAGGTSLATRHVRLDSQAVEKLPGFDDGSFWVQDIAATLPGRMVPATARRVLDLCAAPGGKTMQLAAAGHDVTALDQSQQRLDRLRDNLERTGLAANVITADALEWQPDAPFDAVLLDAPCSATGTFRRHPEVLYRARPGIIAEMAGLQSGLLARAARWVTPGGSLVYAVCSLETQEGEAVVGRFLDAHRHFRVQGPDEAWPDFAKAREDGTVRTLPNLLTEQGGLDGFFIARLVRDA